MEYQFVKYFQNSGNFPNQFNPPATESQIDLVEAELSIRLPEDYKSFLQYTNGFDGFINEFYARFLPVGNIAEATLANCGEFFPWAIYIGTNANAEMIVLDKRNATLIYGFLPFIATDKDFIPLAETFDGLLSRLFHGSVFNN